MVAIRVRLFCISSALLLLSLSAWGAPEKNAAAAEASPNTTLAEGLKTWNDLTERLKHLQAENAAWEMRFNPEREDRNWWNPFWRSAAERNLQRSNELTLQIHALETQRADLENALLESSQHLTQARLSANHPFTSSERELWVTLDAWRFPLWLQRLEEVKKSLENFPTLSQELQRRRRERLEQYGLIAKTLDAYLTWRRTQITPSDPPVLPAQLQAWQTQLLAWQAAVQPWRQETSNAPVSAP
jgi:hypothetical protein